MSNGKPGWIGERLIAAHNIGFPLPMVIAIVVSIGGSVVYLNDRFAEKAEAIVKKVDENRVAITQRTVPPRHSWRRWDMRLWCARVSQSNPQFKCPDPYGQPSPFELPR